MILTSSEADRVFDSIMGSMYGHQPHFMALHSSLNQTIQAGAALWDLLQLLKKM